MKKNIKIATTMERADLLLSHLEKLKERVTDIETQYNFLNHNYSRVCEEAIVRINNLKTGLEKGDDIMGESDSSVYETNNLEARYKLGLVSAESYFEHKDILNGKVGQRQSKLQNAVDSTANGIEYVLDKIGDGLIFPFVKIAQGYNLLIANCGQVRRQTDKRN